MKSLLKGALAGVSMLAMAGAAHAETWQMQSTYPGSLTQLGTLGKVLADRVGVVTDGAVEIEFQEPGALVPALETFDAV
ncbi:MAG: C4-dicarboxylate ABC transporter, partial [Pseudomonadota bacterium]